MAEAAEIAGLGWVASPIISDLIRKSISYLGIDIAKRLHVLETTLIPQFQLTIEAAQHHPHKYMLVKWLARLKGAYFDAESTLHELEYAHLKRMVKEEGNKLVRLSFTIKKSSLLSARKRKLLKQLDKLTKIAAEAETFRELLTIQKTGSKDAIIDGNSPSVTSWLLTDRVFGGDGVVSTSLLTDRVFGRYRERDELINFLLDEQGANSLRESYSVVAITGMGGAGKTTLAKYVYNDEKVKKYLGVRLWLSLSGNLDIIKCTKEIIEYVSGKKCPNLHNLTFLQEILIEVLSESDNIMVVLDDVWYDNSDRDAGNQQWDNFLAPFALHCSRGGTCKILVTSRSSWSFPFALLPGKIVQLSDLAPDDFISLLRYHAIDGLQIYNPQLENDFSDIVSQIAKKMSKSPLVAKVVGNQLRQQPNITFWRATLEKVNLSHTIEVLLWSFQRFDVQLQRCFLFCSIFPRGTPFGLHTLVSNWVALDFIQPSDDNRNVEDIGLEYFQIMVANSIFHLMGQMYTMHDLFHNLAEKLSAGDCFRVTNAEIEIPFTVRHLFLKVNNENLKENLSRICNLSDLRTLILENPFIDDISEIISEISTNFRNLRVLHVESRGYKTLPRVLGDLRNIRLLNFAKSTIEELPDSVSQLYHLQFLLLPSSVKTLPTKLSNLIKLRRIEMYNSDGCQVNTLPPVPYLGKLTSLQCLDEFHVRKEKGHWLQQLGLLKEIGGSLRIVNLENVRDKDEAVQAGLIDKSKLEVLQLVWTESAENGLEIEVIEALQPPANLKLLTIDGYRGSIYPTWLREGPFIENIKDIRFYNCNALTILPPNFHQFHHCSQLVLKNLGALRELSTLPESLAKLSIVKCPCLIFICENELKEGENKLQVDEKHSIMGENELQDVLNHELKSFEQTGAKENCAEQLQIIESIARDNAPEIPVNVTRVWWRCHQQRMNFIVSLPPERARANKLKIPSMLRILVLGYCCVSDETLSDCLREMITLEELYLEGIMTITTLPPAQVLESLLSLRVVEIKHCWNLGSLGGLHELPHLVCFLVEDCWDLELDSDSTPLPPTLQFFIIRYCTVPGAIFKGNLPCLQNVVIENCHVSRSLSFHQLTLLKSLALVNCPGLFSIWGLESRPFINTLHLVLLPNLDVKSVLESWQGCRELCLSSSVMLNELLSSQEFVLPEKLVMKNSEEEAISFEKSDHLQSIKMLEFVECKTKYLPKTLIYFSTLEFLHFKDCQEISELPELPSSVQGITIRGCSVLRERCQPNGIDWHKIRHLQLVEIE